jgi:4-amino-4-deoxy-L-arabinose transferase-like glycosyltransferase
VNWHAFIGNPGQICNKNLIIHRPEREQFPWRGAVLAVHICRFITVAIGAGSVVLTYVVVRELFPERPALVLGATALMAFNPMFIFVNASVNNDALATFVGCLNLLVFLRLARDSLRDPLPLWRYGLVGLTMGLFLLTKLSALTGLILLLVLLAWVSYRRRSWRPLVVGLPIIIGIAALVSGWWFARNWRLYGDLTGLNAFIEIQGTRGGFPSLRDWTEEFVTFRWTYWGLFGAVNVMAPLWVYRFYDALSLAGLVGLALWMIRSGELRRLWLALRDPQYDAHVSLWWVPALWGGFLFVSVLRWTWISYSFQGRLLFPNIGGISALLMVGLHEWTPKRYRPALSLGIGLSLSIVAGMLPFTTILPAYAQPEPLTLSDVPASARVDPVRIGSVARVVGWEFEEQTVRLNDAAGTEDAAVDLVVYWEATTPDGGDYVSFARLLGRGYELVGQINRRPACGMVPTDLWQPGQVWRDPYRIPVAEDARAPSRLRVEVGLYNPEADETLGAVRVGEAKLAPPTSSPEVQEPLVVELADGITLRGYDLVPDSVNAGETITLTLHWKTRETPSTDYQVFVHLLGDGPEPVAQGDGPPLSGDYPTSMWAAGETIADPHPVWMPEHLPTREYRLLVGMYELETLQRLPRVDGQGDSVEIPERVLVR